MPIFECLVERTEIYSKTCHVEAVTAEAAKEKLQRQLSNHGWDSVFNGDDGDYMECSSEVANVQPMDEGETPETYRCIKCGQEVLPIDRQEHLCQHGICDDKTLWWKLGEHFE